MQQIRLENYRCFRDEQTARLAPLTVLIGENNTGKTSFLAMARILSDLSYTFRRPNFTEDPYDLGSFDEIAHYRDAKNGLVSAFKAGFSAQSRSNVGKVTNVDFTFGKRGSVPVPMGLRISIGSAWLEKVFSFGGPYVIRGGTHRGAWEMPLDDDDLTVFNAEWDPMERGYQFLSQTLIFNDSYGKAAFDPLGSSPPIRFEDLSTLYDLENGCSFEFGPQRPFASTPVRSKPRRAYDSARPTSVPEGDYVPMSLADVFSKDLQPWKAIKRRLEDFGKSSGLFDEISIRQPRGRRSDPFQVQVRQFRGPMRNLIDVGYGVSHILPVISEIVRSDSPHLLLLQHPEVYLHPMAQAALGSLFCQVAAPDCQILVETHSDHLINRIRTDIRDGVGMLKANDVSILYFERDALDVHIHSLRIDENGDVMGAPDSFRQFFREETTRDI